MSNQYGSRRDSSLMNFDYAEEMQDLGALGDLDMSETSQKSFHLAPSRPAPLRTKGASLGQILEMHEEQSPSPAKNPS